MTSFKIEDPFTGTVVSKEDLNTEGIHMTLTEHLNTVEGLSTSLGKVANSLADIAIEVSDGQRALRVVSDRLSRDQLYEAKENIENVERIVADIPSHLPRLKAAMEDVMDLAEYL